MSKTLIPFRYKHVALTCLGIALASFPAAAQAADSGGEILYLRQNTFTGNPFVGQSNLSIMKSDGEDQQTLLGGGDRFQVSFSPDGSRTVYAANRDIYTADPDGSNVQRLTTDGATAFNAEPDWSDDGKKIAFTRQCAATRERCIFTINASDGTALTKITQTDPAFAGTDSGPDWAPGSGKIAYAKVLKGGLPNRDEDLYTIDLTSKSEKFLLDSGGADTAPAWNPTGTELILFESDRPDDISTPKNANVWKANTDGSGAAPLVNNKGYDAQPAWSPDGLSIAFVSDRFGDGKTYVKDNYADILVMRADGKNIVQLTKSADLEVAPDWRKSSTSEPRFRVLFQRGKAGTRDVFSTRANGAGTATQLTTNPADDFAATWSPDRSRVAFISNRNGKQQLFTMKADGSDQKQLGNEKLGEYDTPAWSANGQEIIVSVTVGKQSDLYGIQLDGTTRQITKTSYSETCPDISPNGLKIAFTSDQPTYQRDIYSINAADGSGERRLTTTPWGPFSRGSGECPRYSADGTKIAFERKFARISEIATIDASDGKGLRVVKTKTEGNQRPLWSPAGDYLALTDGGEFGYTKPGDIFVSRPDGSGQTQIATDGLATGWR